MTERCAIYTRVSSQAQAGEDSTSLQTQLEDCQKLAEEKGLGIVAELQDIRTGTDRKRPAFRKLISMIEAKEIDAVVAWREDRLYRGFSVVPFYEAIVERPDFSVFLVQENFDRSMMAIKAGMAQHELDTTRQRVEAGWRAHLRAGKPGPGANIKFGYRKNDEGYAEIHPENAKFVRDIFRLYIDGHTQSEIIAALKAKGSTRKWERMGLNRIVKDDTYLSGVQILTRKSGGIEESFNIKFPPIISAAIWALAQQKLASNKGRYRGHSLKYPALLAGLVRCNAHDYAMHIRHERTRNRAYYRCGFHSKRPGEPKNEGCARTYRIEKLDHAVWDEVRNFITNPALISEVVDARAAELEGSIRDNVEDEIRRLAKRLDELEDKRQRQINAYGEDIISKDDLDFQITNLDFEKAAVQREIALAESELMVKLEPAAIRKATEKMMMGSEWKAAQIENYMDDIEACRKLVRQSIENVMMIARFEFLFDSFESLIDSTDPGEVKRTGTVPIIYFRLELPGLTLGEFVQVDRSSLYHAPASG